MPINEHDKINDFLDPGITYTDTEKKEIADMIRGLSLEQTELLAAVQESPYRLTTADEFKEFPHNTEYFNLEANIATPSDLGYRFIAEHTDILLHPKLLGAIDPVPFGEYAAKEEGGFFTKAGYITLSGDEWQKEASRPEPEKKPSIRQRLEEGKKECAAKTPPVPHKGKAEHEI